MFSIIAGDSYAGGFSRFVRKIYKNFMKSVDFTELDIEARANKVASRLQGKGYLPEPFKHGNCMAGSARAQLTAACRSSDGTGPKKCVRLQSCALSALCIVPTLSFLRT